MTNTTLTEQDAAINKLFIRLDELKAQGHGGHVASKEYMTTLRALQVATRDRVRALASQLMTPVQEPIR